MANTHALVLYKNGKEWDRARCPVDYNYVTAIRQLCEWETKILREEPDAKTTAGLEQLS